MATPDLPKAAALNHRRALLHLKRSDPVMAKVIASVGPCRFMTHDHIPYFQYLTRAIVYQQLSTKAASTIYGRFQQLCGGTVLPDHVATLTDVQLRSCGFSSQKARYVKDLAGKVVSGEVVLEGLERHPDEHVIETLTQIKGIGVWSAHMFLMFRLGRPDVLPVGDLGIQNAVQRAYRLRKRPTPKKVEQIGRSWSPHATIASWYLWRSLDGPAK